MNLRNSVQTGKEKTGRLAVSWQAFHHGDAETRRRWDNQTIGQGVALPPDQRTP